MKVCIFLTYLLDILLHLLYPENHNVRLVCDTFYTAHFYYPHLFAHFLVYNLSLWLLIVYCRVWV